MSMYVVGLDYFDDEFKELRGFDIYSSDDGSHMIASVDSVKKILQSGRFVVEGIRLTQDGFKGTKGKLSDFPKSVKGEYKLNKVYVTIISENITDSGLAYEYLAVPGYKKDYVTNLALYEAVKKGKISITNGSFERTSDRTVLKPSIGNYTRNDIRKNKQTLGSEDGTMVGTQEYREELRDKETESLASHLDHGNTVNTIDVKGCDLQLMHLKTDPDDENELDVGQKLTLGLIWLQDVKPFSAFLLHATPRIPTLEVDTMGVSATKFFFNPYFICRVTLEELLFALMHEAAHIYMGHPTRLQGGRVDQYIANVACDLYVNKSIAVEYGISFKSDNSRSGNSAVIEKVSGGRRDRRLTMLNDICYSDDVDVAKDTPELIYDRLIKENQDKVGKGGKGQKSQQSQGQTQDQSGQGQGQGQNQQGQSQQNQQGQQGQGQNQQGQGQNQPGQAQNQQGQGQQGQGQGQQGQGQGQQGQGQGQQGQGQGQQGQGQGQQGQGQGQNQQGQGQNQQGQDGQGNGDCITYNGKPVASLQDNLDNDLVMASDEEGKSDDVLKQEIKDRIASAVTEAKAKGFSLGLSGIELAAIEEFNAPKIPFRSLFRQYLNKASATRTSYANPDRRFIHQNIIIPSEVPSELDMLSRLYICIDSSGSIGDKELGQALNMVRQMLNSYKASAHIMYWDSEVNLVKPFSTVKEAMSIKPMGGGGTNPNVIFQYFDSKEYKRYSKNAGKPNLICIITDGYFGEVDKSYRKKYKDTIWIVNSDLYSKFKQPFGKKAIITERKD